MELLVLVLAWLAYKQVNFQFTNNLRTKIQQISINAFHAVNLPSGWQFLLMVVLPSLLVWFAIYWMHSVMPGTAWLFEFCIGLALLIFAFGSGDYKKRCEDFIHLTEQEYEKQALDVAIEHLGVEETLTAPSQSELMAKVRKGVNQVGFERFFYPAFWFLAFGPAGILLVLLLKYLHRSANLEQQDESGDELGNETDSEQESGVLPNASAKVENLTHAMQWIPVRVLGITYAFVGNFVSCFNEWLKDIVEPANSISSSLNTYANASLTSEESDQNACLLANVALVERSQVVWLVLVACFFIFGATN